MLYTTTYLLASAWASCELCLYFMKGAGSSNAIRRPTQLRRRCFHAGSWVGSGFELQRAILKNFATFSSLWATASSSLFLFRDERAGADGSPQRQSRQCGCPALTRLPHLEHTLICPAAAHFSEQKCAPSRRTGCSLPGAAALPHSMQRSWSWPHTF